MKQKLTLFVIVAALSGTAWAVGDTDSSASNEGQLQSPQNGAAQQPEQEQVQTGEEAPIQKETLTEEQVREIQQALQQAGHDPGEIDGIWGPQTESALRDFQQAEGLQPTGEPDVRTINALDLAPLFQEHLFEEQHEQPMDTQPDEEADEETYNQ